MLIYDIVIKEVDGVVRLAFNPTSRKSLQSLWKLKCPKACANPPEL